MMTNSFTAEVQNLDPIHSAGSINNNDNNNNNNSIVINHNNNDNNNTSNPSSQGMITPAPSDVDTTNETAVSFADYINNFIPDGELEATYREFIRANGVEAFLKKKINKSMSRRELCTLILNLGYPKKAVEDYSILTVRELAGVLLRLLLDDKSLLQDGEDRNNNNSDEDTSMEHSSDEDSETEEHEKETIRRPGVFVQPPVPPFKYGLKNFLQGLFYAKKIVVITGAGISTSLGIPDFRSFQGFYSQLSNLNLSDPQKVFDLETFKKEPQLFYTIAHMVLPPEGKFAVFHAFLKLLQNKKKLLRNYTQNIDNLEQRAGLHATRLIQCHGSFSHAKCITCKASFKGEKIYKHIRKRQVPRCSNCWENTLEAEVIYGVIKPTITFFGEDLPERFHRLHTRDLRNADMVIVSGTSLNVNPVAGLVEKVPHHVPKILINKDPIEDLGSLFNLKLNGLCDEVVGFICKCLGDDWNMNHIDYDPKSDYSVETVNSNTYNIKKRT